MGPRKADYRERKDTVLGIVVDQYIQTVNPVSSSYIAREYSLDLSPATIRNILSELEADGYLTHPHTSAGRIPTQLGYRYYVDHLMNEIQLLKVEKERIKMEYVQHVSELESLMEKTSEYISHVTHYTSIISIDGREQLFYKGTGHIVEYPQPYDVERIRHILHALEEKERILKIINRDLEAKIQIYIGQELDCSEIDGCSMVVSSYQSEKGHSGRIAVLGPTRMNYGRVVSTVEYFSDLMSEALDASE